MNESVDGSWKKTSCALCAQNCGLEILVNENRIVKVRGDKANPRSQGYCCRKGLNIGFFQHHKDRLTHPLKRNGNKFERISWDQATNEISNKLKQIINDHGPKSLAYVGGGGQGCHFEAAFGVRLLRGLGSKYHYNALGQELTGMFWAHGRAFGRQHLMAIPDEKNTDMLVSIGWNGMMSHQMAQARRHLKRISDDPDKLLVVIDPRRTETTRIADIHLPVRPGTDALLVRAMIAIILQEGWQNDEYIKSNVSGLDLIKPYFENFNAKAALDVCSLDYSQVREVCRLFATRRSSLHSDLGILMNRHSTLTSYLLVVLLTVCGRIGSVGGNVFPGRLMPLGAHSDERNPKTWRTAVTGFPAIMGVFPPNVMPEEIDSDHPERLRAVLVSGSNPLRSYADTTAYERAFKKLELLVTIEVAMTETASMSHYVLPAKSAYEKWDGTFFTWTYPDVFFQMRHPAIETAGEALEESEIMTKLADKLGLLPDLPTELYEAAKKDRMTFGLALMNYVQTNPSVANMLPFVVAKTLGPELGSFNLAAFWGMLQITPGSFRSDAARAGFATGPLMGEQIFQAIMKSPQGVIVGKSDTEKGLAELRTEDKKINLYVPELEPYLNQVTPEAEALALEVCTDYPFTLMAGKHFDHNANTLMRDPSWIPANSKPCVMEISPRDAEKLGIVDGQKVRVTTEAGSVETQASIDENAMNGFVVVPHGFGLVYDGKQYGVNVNVLTKNTNRDPIAATPLHRFQRCRIDTI
ncbi:MAG: molybdopterin-dependent oxidoreductase [Deltaproteobacteria bacterium]|nr:molybdopterin-dependent oxidoreductase [Deltaproteobacteria bacterium]